MIFVEDRLVKVGGVVLPGLLKSIEVTETALKVKDQFAALIDAFLREVKEA